MSTTPAFKYRGPDKRCPFPFNRDSVTVPTVTDAAYKGRHALLPDAAGDEGLAEACRLWWLTESFTLTLTATAGSNTETLSFPRPSFPAPASRCSLEGQLARPDAAGGIVWGGHNSTPAPTWGPDPLNSYQAVGIRYAQDVSRWCLVVQHLLISTSDDTSTVVTAEIGGPDPYNNYWTGLQCDEINLVCFEGTTAYTRTLVSNLNILGYSFPLYKQRDFDNMGTGLNATPPDGSVSGSSSSTFYTVAL